MSLYRFPYTIHHPEHGPAVVVGVAGKLLTSYRRKPRPLTPERARSILFRYISKARLAGLELELGRLPHLEAVEGVEGEPMPLRVAIPITWHQCDSGCPGWIHMESPKEVQACDACDRFNVWDRKAFDHNDRPGGGYVTRDDLAQEAHARECGCAWGKRRNARK